MATLQISAGRGPIEVRQFAAELAAWVLCALPQTHQIAASSGSARVDVGGLDVRAWVGTHVLVHAARGKGQRRRWFASMVLLPEADLPDFDPAHIVVRADRAGGPGGQHVNTTASAVRATYPPLGLSVRVTGQRSQHQNRAEAVRALEAQHQALRSAHEVHVGKTGWRAHDRLVRGHPVGRWRRSGGRLVPEELPTAGGWAPR